MLQPTFHGSWWEGMKRGPSFCRSPNNLYISNNLITGCDNQFSLWDVLAREIEWIFPCLLWPLSSELLILPFWKKKKSTYYKTNCCNSGPKTTVKKTQQSEINRIQTNSWKHLLKISLDCASLDWLQMHSQRSRK